MPPGTLILRADASVALGTGHVMRCLALAQAWQDEGGECIFAMAEATTATERRVRAEKCAVVRMSCPACSPQDAALLAELARAHHAGWVVVDGYQFDAEYHRNVKAAGLKLLVVDDGGRYEGHSADLVLDQSIGAGEMTGGERTGSAQLLLGSRYVMLRREFDQWRKWKREIPNTARRLLVTIGGSDPDGLTLKLVQILPRVCLPGMLTTVVIGGSNPQGSQLQRAADATGAPIELVRDPPNLPELMAQSDLAVICGGGTLWELLYMGCAILSYARGALQEQVIARFGTLGAVHDLGPIETFDVARLTSAIAVLAGRERREEMSRMGRKMVDGEGARRVLRRMLKGVE